MSQKQVMPKSEDLSRSLEINAIWTFDTEFPTMYMICRLQQAIQFSCNIV